MGYNVTGIITDGGDNIIRAVEYVYSDVPRQRCMVHVQNHLESRGFHACGVNLI